MHEPCATTTRSPLVRLNNGVEIPQLGFGVLRIPDAETAAAVREAIRVGYRHVDTAARYGNEVGVGEAIRSSGLPRQEIFVTTKLANERHGRRSARAALDESLDRLGLDYVDLYLIHWPLPMDGRFVDAWLGLEDALTSGKARAIGVSNFLPAQLDKLLAHGSVTPAVNQIELHPAYQQRELVDYNARHGIRTEAWSPLGRGAYPLLEDDHVLAVARDVERTPAQVVIRWHLQSGRIVFPKSTDPKRIRENFDVFDFTLSDAHISAMDQLDRGLRTGPDPAVFTG